MHEKFTVLRSRCTSISIRESDLRHYLAHCHIDAHVTQGLSITQSQHDLLFMKTPQGYNLYHLLTLKRSTVFKHYLCAVVNKEHIFLFFHFMNIYNILITGHTVPYTVV